MNDTLKTHKKKIIGGGAGIGISTVVYLFFQLNLSIPALQKVPDTMSRVTTLEARIDSIDKSLMAEISKSRESRENMIRQIAMLTAQLEMNQVLQEEMRSDIKELLKR